MKQLFDRLLQAGAAALAALRDPGSGSGATDYPGIADGWVIYAVGDLHGRSDCLRAAHRLIDADRARRPNLASREIYLGDYVDRGPDTAGVIDVLLARAVTKDCRFLRGNHERVMSDFLTGEITLDAWRQIGGNETILSYGQDPRLLAPLGDNAGAVFAGCLPEAHRDFLAGLRKCEAHGPYLFVHAGVRPGVPLVDQEEADLLWIREPFLSATVDFGAIVVHGHSPAAAPERQPNRINLDIGAYATGRLALARLDSEGLALFCVDARDGKLATDL